jgi:hypothetical protein
MQSPSPEQTCRHPDAASQIARPQSSVAAGRQAPAVHMRAETKRPLLSQKAAAHWVPAP